MRWLPHRFRMPAWVGVSALVLAFAAEAHAMSPELRDRLGAATVYIEVEFSLSPSDWSALPKEVQERIGRRPTVQASGSGFLITPEGHVITNSHVVEGFTELIYPDGTRKIVRGATRAERFDPDNPSAPFSLRYVRSSLRAVVRSGEDGEETYPVSVQRVDPQTDLALLKLASPREFDHLKLDIDGSHDVGSPVYMSGFPGGLLPDIAPFADGSDSGRFANRHPRASINSGMITALRSYEGERRYQLDIRANHGNSGGPIVAESGEVIGVLYAGIDTMQSINYAIPVAYIARVLRPELSRRVFGPAYQGISSGSSDDQNYDAFLSSGDFSFD